MHPPHVSAKGTQAQGWKGLKSKPWLSSSPGPGCPQPHCLNGFRETRRLTAGLGCRGRKTHEQQLLTPESVPAFQLSFHSKDPIRGLSGPLLPALLALCHPLQSWHLPLPSHGQSRAPRGGLGVGGGEASPDGLVVTVAALALLVSRRSLPPGALLTLHPLIHSNMCSSMSWCRVQS